MFYRVILFLTIIAVGGSTSNSGYAEDLKLNLTTKIAPTFFISDGLDPDGSLLANYQRGLNYAIDYFGNYGPYYIYLLGPGNESDLKDIFRKRAHSRLIPDSNLSEEEQIEAFLKRPNVMEEMKAVLSGEAAGGLTWSEPERRVYEDVTTNATERAKDPIENTWGALHEYHHVFQVAHSDSYQERSSETNFNSWMLEGMATYSSAKFMERLGLADFKQYMMDLRQSGANIGRPGINEFLAATNTFHLDNESHWEDGNAPQVYYMLGAWATAYLIHVQGINEKTVLKHWFMDVLKIGKSKAFAQHMQLSLEEFYLKFDAFIRLPDDEVMKIFETQLELE